MKGAGSRSEQDCRIVEHVPPASGLGRVFETAGKATKFFVDEPAVDSEILVPVGLLGVVRKSVGGSIPHGPRKVVTYAHAVFPSELVGCGPRGIGFEGQVNQLVHGTQKITRVLGGDVEFEEIRLHVWHGNVQPSLGFLHLAFRITHRLKIVGKGFLIMFGERTVQGIRILQEVVESTFAQGKAALGIRAALDEEHVEDALGLVFGGNGSALGIVRHSVSSARGTSAAVGRHDQRVMPGVFADLGGKHLIERNAVLIGIVHGSGVGAGEKLVGIAVPMNFSDCGVGQAGKHG